MEGGEDPAVPSTSGYYQGTKKTKIPSSSDEDSSDEKVKISFKKLRRNRQRRRRSKRKVTSKKSVKKHVSIATKNSEPQCKLIAIKISTDDPDPEKAIDCARSSTSNPASPEPQQNEEVPAAQESAPVLPSDGL